MHQPACITLGSLFTNAFHKQRSLLWVGSLQSVRGNIWSWRRAFSDSRTPTMNLLLSSSPLHPPLFLHPFSPPTSTSFLPSSTRLATHIVASCRPPLICATRGISQLQEQLPNQIRDVAVVIVPGWLSDCSQYEPMASHMRSRGLAAVVVPIKWYNWMPSLGGRSVRPILDRIDATISLVLVDQQEQNLWSFGNEEEQDDSNSDYDQSREVAPGYTLGSFFKEFTNPKNGAQPPFANSQHLDHFAQISQVDNTILYAERYLDKPLKKVILVAHSAGGWICRILLGSKVPYDGRLYSAAGRVCGLVTLGTPHVCTDKLTKRNMEFVNENYPGTAEAEFGVQYVCVAGKFAKGESQFGGLLKDFAWQSYELCCGRGDVWGDGVIPLECAIGLEGAQHIILEGVEHFPTLQEKELRNWYGTPNVMDDWLPAVLRIALSNETKAARA